MLANVSVFRVCVFPAPRRQPTHAEGGELRVEVRHVAVLGGAVHDHVTAAAEAGCDVA